MTGRWQLHWVGAAELRALESADADRPGAPASIALSRTDAAWLALVCAHDNVASQHVAALVWPQADAARALNSLRQRVHRMRKASGARLVEMTATLRLANDLRAPATDNFDALLADPQAPATTLLAGFDYDGESEFAAWLSEQRSSDRRRMLEALAQTASDDERNGAIARAVRLSERLVSETPLHEHSHRRLMRLHYLRGDTAAAVAAFERCESLLKDELGLAPDAETLALLRSIETARLERPVRGGALPVALARPPRLVGRAAALAALHDAEQAGRLAIVEGDAGQGKTRLIEAALQGRADALHVQARTGDAAVPLGTLARLLRAVDERGRLRHGAAADAAARPLALPDAASDAASVVAGRAASDAANSAASDAAAAASTAPLQAAIDTLPAPRVLARLSAHLADAHAGGLALVAVDDLHFADRASVELLLALTQADELRALRWVLAMRPPAAASEAPVRTAAWLGDLREAPSAQWIRLQPLSAAELVQLIDTLAPPGADVPALAAALHRHTGGNPLFVIETLRAAWAAGPSAGAALPRPQALAHLIQQRLARLSPPALALARVAAVAVPDFSIELAEHALEQPALRMADAWSELENADVLRGELFAHDLVHDAVVQATPEVVRARAHRQVAAFLVARGAPPARVARHWLDGGEGALAAAAYGDAARRARAGNRMREAAELMERAAQGHALAAAPDLAFAQRCRAVEMVLLADGVDAALHALAVLSAEPVAALAGALPLGLARIGVLRFAMRFDELAAAARDVLALAAAATLATAAAVPAVPAVTALPDAPAAADAVAIASSALALALQHQGDLPGALAVLRNAEPDAERAPDPEARLIFTSEAASIWMAADRPKEVLVLLQRSHALASEAGLVAEQVTSLMNLTALRLRRGDAASALNAAQQVERLLAEPAQAQLQWAWNRIHVAIALDALGRFGAALQAFESAREGLPPAHGLMVLRANRLSELWLTLGQTARAAALVPLRPDTALPRATQAAVIRQRAAVERALGHDDQALLREAQALAAEGSAYDRLVVQIDLARHAEDGERADASLLDAVRQAEAFEYFPLAQRATGARLQRRLRDGLHDGVAELADALERLQAAAAGERMPQPQGWLWIGKAHLATGNKAAAHRALAAGWRDLHLNALPSVPAEFQDSFLERNPAHRELRALVVRERVDGLG